jgi:hypothetical protein
MFDFVECVRWGKAEFEYETVYLINHEGDREVLLQSISDDSLCIDHHLQKLIKSGAKKTGRDGPLRPRQPQE